MKQTQLKKMVQAAIALRQERITHFMVCDQKNNPQIIEMRLRLQGELEAYDAVLSALNDYPVLLRAAGSRP